MTRTAGSRIMNEAPQQDDNPLHVVHITAEMAPIAKVRSQEVAGNVQLVPKANYDCC